ncbi:hypothetical protein JCM3774_005807, partial [Rhodotorula dairenensis]
PPIPADDFEKYWHVASKLVPLPGAQSAPVSAAPTGSSASPSAGLEGRLPDADRVRHVPLRVYLPPSGPSAGSITVVQELVAPTRRDGSPTTLRHALSQLVPLLFPAPPPPPPLASSSLSSSSTAPPPPRPPPPPPPLAYPLIHGIYPPVETELGWLGACMAGPDGWVHVVIVLDERGEPAALLPDRTA